MGQQPEALYFAVLVLFLVAVRSPWPWTRGGGIVLLVVATLGGGLVLRRPEIGAAVVEARRLPVTVLALLTGVVVWWSLHKERSRAAFEKLSAETLSAELPRVEPATAAGQLARRRARWLGLVLGIVAVAAASVLLGAPEPADGPPWFLAGLAALAPLLGETFVYRLVPAAALLALLLAPDLDAHDPETPAPFGGRRDEVPFFLFAWLAVGVVPIVVAALRPDFGAAPSPTLASRFWIDWIGVAPPSLWMLRQLPGIVLYLLIFAVLPWRLPAWRATRGVFARHLRRLGARRYALVMTLAGLLILVPLKLALQWLLAIGPWLSWPGGGP